MSLVFALFGAFQYIFTSDHQSQREITAIGLLFVASYLMAGLDIIGTYSWRLDENVRNRPDSITRKTWEMPSRKNCE